MNFDLQRLFTPSAWVQSTPTNWEWDSKLNEILDTNPKILKINDFWVVLDSKVAEDVEKKSLVLWIGNFPYAYGYPYNFSQELLPSYKTRKRLKKYLENSFLEKIT